MQLVESGGRLKERRCAFVGRLEATKGIKSWEGTVSSRLVIDLMSNYRLYLLRASPKVQFSRPHRTRNSSTNVDRRPCRTRLGSHRARICWMAALSPGASLPRRGSTVVTMLRLWFARRRGAPDWPFVGKFSTMRVRRVALASAWLIACCERALVIESWLVALFTARRVCPGGSPNRGAAWSASGGRLGSLAPAER